MTCHIKCSSEAPSTCGLPTDYIHYFTSIMGKIERNSKNFTLEDTNQIKIKGWLKVPRYVENVKSMLIVYILLEKYSLHYTYPWHFF